MAEHTREQPIVTPAPQCRRVLRMKPETLAFAAALLGIIAAAPSAIPAISMVGLVPALLALAALSRRRWRFILLVEKDALHGGQKFRRLAGTAAQARGRGARRRGQGALVWRRGGACRCRCKGSAAQRRRKECR